MFIETYHFPAGILKKIKYRYPQLSNEQVPRVMAGLREYFLICRKSGFVSMPSQVVDVAWNEFILFTELYEEFCKCGAGRFIHHTPAEVMPTSSLAEEGIKHAWYLSCLREEINPKTPVRLPLLFALDVELETPDGFRYSLDCTGLDNEHCDGQIGCNGGGPGCVVGYAGCGGF